MHHSEHPKWLLYFKYAIIKKSKQLLQCDKITTHKRADRCKQKEENSWKSPPPRRALDHFIHKKHPDALYIGCELPPCTTTIDSAVGTSAKHLTTPILLRITVSSNSKFSLVSSKLDMKELTILPNCLCPTISLASSALNLCFNESNFNHFVIWIS